MKRGVIVFIALYVLVPSVTLAQIPSVYTNENYDVSEHDTPVSLFQYETGGFYGFTETGKFYQQLPIQNLYSIKLHRFSIDEAYFYVSDRGVINAPGDLVALSIYMSRV